MRVLFIALGSLVSSVTLAAAPGPLPGNASSFDAFTTLAGFDQRMEFLAAMPWELAKAYEYLGPDHAGRTVEGDLSEYLLTQSAQEKLASLRKAAAATVATPEDALAEEVLGPLKTSASAEFCRLSAIAMYWYGVAMGSHLRSDLDEQILRLPEERRRDATATLDALSEGKSAPRPSASMLTEECNNRGAPDLDQQRQEYERLARLTDGYSKFRKDLADSLSDLLATGKIPPEEFQRTTPCPAPPPGQTGGPRVSVRRQGDVSDYYPPRERNLGISGKVQVGMLYDATGCITSVRVLRTSASSAIDRAAAMLSLDMELNPAVVDGKPVPGGVTRQITFSLLEAE